MASVMDFYAKQLDPVIGGKITDFINDKEEEFFGLRVENNGKIYLLWILRDDEGNGPGSFEIDEVNK